MTVIAFLDMGLSEMVVCGFVALVLFGGRLPEVMRNLGATYRNFRKGMEDLKQQAGVDVKMPRLDSPKPYAPMPRPTPDPRLTPAPQAPSPADGTPVPTSPPSPASAAPTETSGPRCAVPPSRSGDDDPPPV